MQGALLKRASVWCYWRASNFVNRRFARLPPTWDAGFAVPPTRLIEAVIKGGDVRAYLLGGRLAADDIRAVLAATDIPVDSLTSVLDFGCGSGRVIRNLHQDFPDLHGCDYNPDLTAWCQKHLPFAFTTNQLDPPLPYDDASFDLVHALSVFTHLDRARQFLWRDEIARVLRPGGVAIITTQGTRFSLALSDADRGLFESGEFVALERQSVGKNGYSALHPEQFVREKFATSGFEVAGFFPWAASGGGQDIWVFRTP